MPKRITRRTLVALAAAMPARAQTANPPAPIPATPEDEHKAIAAQFRASADALAKVALPMSTEPATRFKA